jgi:glycosyltransferase involved in cell wall biosynthesis
MRVGLVSFSGSPESPELIRPDGHVPALATALAEQGDQVVVYARRQEGAENRPGEAAYRTVELPAGPPAALSEADAITHLGAFVHELGRELSRSAPDVVHSHTWLAGLATHLAARSHSVPIAHTCHRLQLDNHAAPTRRRVPNSQIRAERAVAQHADRIIALSHAEQDLLARIGVPSERVTVVPPGVDTDRLNPDGPADERRMPHRLVLFGPLGAAAATVSALAGLTDTELVIVDASAEPGEPAPRDTEKLRRLAAELDVAGRIRLAGWSGLEQRASLLRSSDLALSFASADRCETGHLEAMACAVPVVACTPESADAVVDGVNGIHLIDPEPRQLARSLRELLDSPTLRQGMGMAARDRATGRYSWERIATETAQVYRELVGVDAEIEPAIEAEANDGDSTPASRGFDQGESGIRPGDGPLPRPKAEHTIQAAR